jgi:hypothetical protein
VKKMKKTRFYRGVRCPRCQGPAFAGQPSPRVYEPGEEVFLDFCAHCEALVQGEAIDIALRTALTEKQAWRVIVSRYPPAPRQEAGPHNG